MGSCRAPQAKRYKRESTIDEAIQEGTFKNLDAITMAEGGHHSLEAAMRLELRSMRCASR